MRPDVTKSILIGGFALLIASFSLGLAWPDWRWVSYPAHAGLEALGTLSALAITGFILILLRNQEIPGCYAWLAAGLAAMGLLDGLHALLQAGTAFVWTHCLANAVGGLLFACLWLPERKTRSARFAPLVIGSSAALAVALGCLSIAYEAHLPKMLENGEYTALATAMNLIGGAGFLAATIHILRDGSQISQLERLVFATHASLFAIAGMLFELSTLWDPTWWLWHVMRSCAYLVAFQYFFNLFHRQILTLKATEDRLRHALDTVFDTTTEGVLFVDHAGQIVNLNPAARIMFRLEGEVPTGLRLRDYLTDPATLPNVDAALSGHNLLGLRRDGTVFQAETSQTLLRPGGPFSRLVAVRDISERKEAERRVLQLVSELRNSKAELERSNAELDTFAYVASHDLRSPLRTIQNAVLWLEEDLTEHFTEDTRETMDIILRRTRRMEHLLEDLLLHSRIGRGEVDQDIIPGGELVQMIHELAPEREGFRICADSGFDRILVQKIPLLHILLSLVDNAIKHHDGTSGSVFLAAAETADSLVFTVTDDGPGIARKYQDRIFELFTTLQPRDKVEGSGMGLAIARKYASVSGGTISVFSDGRGCRFTVIWPKPTSAATPVERRA